MNEPPAIDCPPNHRLVKLRKCCRCRTVNPEDEAVKRPHKKFSGATEDVCPKCGASSYYLHHAGEKKAPRHAVYRASPWPVSTVAPPLNLAACLLTAKELETMDIPQRPQIVVGSFILSQQPNGKIWIQHRDGEGMMTAADKLEKALSKFWGEEF